MRLSRVVLCSWLLLAVCWGCSTDNDHESAPGIRGVWVQARSIKTPQEADELLARIEAARFDAVFVNVLAYGHAYYESTLLKKHPDLASDYDPLAYVIEQAHQRGIAVHTWLVTGPMGYRGEPGPTFTEHPDWAMSGPDGRQTFWLNYTRPDVRQFIGDLVLEIVRHYDVDGVHFDYTRYPGPEWGYDPYSLELFAEEYGVDPEVLRYSELPAYATFKGNPLADVDTAQVLAVFDDGQPAVLLNSYGAGKAILLNWNASERQVAASSEILDRSINYLIDENGEVYILRSEKNAAKYGSEGFDNGIAWLEDLGRRSIEITEADVATLDTRGVLILPNVYLINAQVASDLADFVRRGGGVILIDGPAPSIEDRNLQAVTGMRTRGGYFEAPRLLIAAQGHDIIPNSNRTLTLEDYQALDAQWKTFRKQGINKLLQEVYRRIKQETPDVLVSITVSGNQETLAERHLLDWQTWLEGGYVDLIIPRAYVDQDEPLAPIIADWQPIMQNSDQIVLGLKTHISQNGKSVPKTPERVLGEIALAQANGSNGIVLFDIERTSDDVLEALAIGPFSTQMIFLPLMWVHEVLLVDGHSTDGTVEVARRLRPDIRIAPQEGRGKGAALRTGFAAATGDIVVMLDADGSTDPAEISAFVGVLLAGADFAKGSRFLQGGDTADMPLYRRLGDWGFTVLVRLLFGGRYSDLCYGYNAFWSRVLPQLNLARISDTDGTCDA